MNGWEDSAAAWIADMGEAGDRGRQFVLDPYMAERIPGRGFTTALDVGCGEGRLCRMMQGWGIATTGLDPTQALLAHAISRDPKGRYILAGAEAMPLDSEAFDLVVSCLSLIDIPDYRAAVAEMARVLKPGGTLLVANLTPTASSRGPRWIKDAQGRKLHYGVDSCMDETDGWEEWRGIRIRNWHRPLSSYMQAFLGADLILRRFDEPMPTNPDTAWAKDYRRVPWYMATEWLKPEA